MYYLTAMIYHTDVNAAVCILADSLVVKAYIMYVGNFYLLETNYKQVSKVIVNKWRSGRILKNKKKEMLI